MPSHHTTIMAQLTSTAQVVIKFTMLETCPWLSLLYTLSFSDLHVCFGVEK